MFLDDSGEFGYQARRVHWPIISHRCPFRILEIMKLADRPIPITQIPIGTANIQITARSSTITAS